MIGVKQFPHPNTGRVRAGKKKKKDRRFCQDLLKLPPTRSPGPKGRGLCMNTSSDVIHEQVSHSAATWNREQWAPLIACCLNGCHRSCRILPQCSSMRRPLCPRMLARANTRSVRERKHQNKRGSISLPQVFIQTNWSRAAGYLCIYSVRLMGPRSLITMTSQF